MTLAKHFAGVGIQAQNSHCERKCQRDVILGVLEWREFWENQIDPHCLNIWWRAGQLRNQKAFKALQYLERKQNKTRRFILGDGAPTL